jgi:hypothetical protein
MAMLGFFIAATYVAGLAHFIEAIPAYSPPRVVYSCCWPCCAVSLALAAPESLFDDWISFVTGRLRSATPPR